MAITVQEALERYPALLIEVVHLRERVLGMERREVTFRSEIDARDDFIQRLMAELDKHAWNSFNHVLPNPSIVALLKEGNFGNHTNTEAPSTDVASPTTSDRGPGEREDLVGWCGSWEVPDRFRLLPEERTAE